MQTKTVNMPTSKHLTCPIISVIFRFNHLLLFLICLRFNQLLQKSIKFHFFHWLNIKCILQKFTFYKRTDNHNQTLIFISSTIDDVLFNALRKSFIYQFI